MHAPTLLPVLLWSGCLLVGPELAHERLDPDDDGVEYGIDCDPFDNAVTVPTWYADGDGDGQGDANVTRAACEPPSGFVADRSDCDDGDGAVHTGADEVCDGIDNDCNGLVDLDDGGLLAGSATWYADLDGDDFGSGDPLETCTPPPDFVVDNSDCADFDDTRHPGAPEYCNGVDDDCDNVVDEPDAVDAHSFWIDADDDDYGAVGTVPITSCADEVAGHVPNDADCDDGNRDVAPGKPEICDELDNDCDIAIDGDDPDVEAPTWYKDHDGDLWGGPIPLAVCDPPTNENYVERGGDCDESDPAVFPGATEFCNSVDDDCNELVDDDTDPASWPTLYLDEDGDGHGNPEKIWRWCAPFDDTWVALGDDCLPLDPLSYPGVQERCDEIDNDCDEIVDEDTPPTWHVDEDGDGFGSDTGERICTPPDDDKEYVLEIGDCDDADASLFPGAPEICDGRDNDCTGKADDDPVDPTTFYADDDDDGDGDPANLIRACKAPPDYVRNRRDCAPDDPARNTDAVEVCSGMDEDCDGWVDESDPSLSAPTYFLDHDLDGYGDDASPEIPRCNPGTGYAATADDCEDTSFFVHPFADETCNGYDDDCDGLADDADPLLTDAPTWYVDADSDGHGSDDASATTYVQCTVREGYATNDDDCDDADPSTYYGHPELCDPKDQDCDGIGIEGDPSWYLDGDDDGFGDGPATAQCDPPTEAHVLFDGDCDAVDPDVHPGADEHCNGVDDDCSGTADDDPVDGSAWYVDPDDDGVGSGPPVIACSPPTSYVAWTGDCAAWDPSRYPATEDAAGPDEICNAIDDDCNGLADDEDPGLTGAPVWYVDADADSYGDTSTMSQSCAAPPEGIANPGDCDDGRFYVHPGATETCDATDQNCDGTVDEGGVCPCTAEAYGTSTYLLCDEALTWGDARSSCADFGYGLVSIDDESERVWLNATWAPDSAWIGLQLEAGVWQWEIGNPSTAGWYDDEPDGSGACAILEGVGWGDESCAALHPYTCETCTPFTWYADLDSDGHGDLDAPLSSCTRPPGHVASSDDCDDGDGTVRPGADESCNDQDDDCDGLADDDDPDVLESEQLPWYKDGDEDGFGRDLSVLACEQPDGFAAVGGDCDDGNDQVGPGASEVAGNQTDEDCDDIIACFVDSDGDDYGTPDVIAGDDLDCLDDGESYFDDDCAPDDAGIHPGAVEIVGNTKDEDCLYGIACYYDQDADEHAALVDPALLHSPDWADCDAQPNLASVADDCDDLDPTAYPGATETPGNHVDEDCDDEILCYEDTDQDTHGGLDEATVTSADDGCDDAGESLIHDDCADDDELVHPDAAEVLGNQVDEDCSGAAGCYLDADGDGHGNDDEELASDDRDDTSDCKGTDYASHDATDCDDSDPLVSQDGEEGPTGDLVCSDGSDNDCDGDLDADDEVCSNLPPRLSFYVSPPAGPVGTSFYFDATATLDDRDALLELSFAYDVGSGFVAGDSWKTQVLSDPGETVVWVRATDLDGAVAYESFSVFTAEEDAFAEVTTATDEDDPGATVATPLGTGLSLREAVGIAGDGWLVYVPDDLDLKVDSPISLDKTDLVVVGDRATLSAGGGLTEDWCAYLAGSGVRVFGLEVYGCTLTFSEGSIGGQIARTILHDTAAPTGTSIEGIDTTFGPGNYVYAHTNECAQIRAHGDILVMNNRFQFCNFGVSIANDGDDLVGTVTMVGNVFYDIDGWAVHVNRPTVLEHNTLYNIGSDAVVVDPTVADDVLLTGNVFHQIDGQPVHAEADFVNDYNLFSTYTTASGPEFTPGGNTVWSDPQFVDPSDPYDLDLRLYVTSPAIDAGDPSLGLDLNGPASESWYGEAPDIGAFESPYRQP